MPARPRAPLFFLTDTPTARLYTLSLHDALPISPAAILTGVQWCLVLLAIATFSRFPADNPIPLATRLSDRKSTRLNSSHSQISYAVFCLKKKRHHAPQHPSPLTTPDSVIA